MQITRRQFAIVSGISTGMARAAAAGGKEYARATVERRVYDRAGAVPPVSALQRCGMTHVRCRDRGTNVELAIVFRSFAERACAWDRFNSDPEWCALRESREVRLREIAFC